MNEEKFKIAVKTILDELGENTEREGIKATPNRVARLYWNIFYGYRKNLVVMNENERNGTIPDDVIPITVFKNKQEGMIIRNVNGISFCEHHIVPFSYTAHIGIIADKYLLGMNKIDAIVKYFGARLQIQEVMTAQIADWIMENLKPKGIIVVIEGEHFCAKLQKDEGKFTTSEVRGVFKNENARMEFLQLIK